MRKLWIADGVTDEVVAEALAAGATEIVDGIPPALVGLVPPGTLGYVEVADPEPPADAPAVDPVDALRDALAPITSSSTSATVRTALLNLKAALGQ